MELTRNGASPDEGYRRRMSGIQTRIRRILAGILIAILVAVVVIVVACVGGTKSAASEESKARLLLEWDGDCPRKTNDCPASFSTDPPPLLLVSLDGFRPDYLGKGFTPILDKIARCGTRADFLFPVFPTKTFPNHYTQVTGLYPAAHGIVDNSMFDPTRNKTFKVGKRSITESFWWKAEPIWLTAQRQGRQSATFFWPGSDVEINGSRPTFYRNYSSDVPFEARVDQVLDWLILPSRPSLLTMYLNEPDHTAHRHGTQSQQTNGALQRVDGILERLLLGLQERNLTDCINIFIMSDHGMSDVDCSRVLSLQNYINVSSVDTVLGPFGRLRLKDTDRAEEEEEELMSALRCQRDRLRVYRKEHLPVRMHYADSPRIEPILLDTDSGWTIARDAVSPGDWFCTGGSHGYDNLFPDMRALFIALGPSIKKNFTIKPFLSVELYELMCELIDIVPNPNNGTRGSLHHVLQKPRRPLPVEAEPLSAPASAELPQGEEYDERVEAAHCPCLQSYRQSMTRYVPGHHAPFGIPYSPEENDTLLLLQNTDYLLAYSTLNRMPAWTAFTPHIIPSEAQEVCWTGDARIPIDDTVQCTDYNSSLFLQRPLYPPAFSEPAMRSEASLVSNSIPKSLDHSSFLEREMIRILGQWAAQSGQLHVLMGPAFDLFGTGVEPTIEDFKKQRSVHGRLLVPTHLFVVVAWCSGTADRIADCLPSDLAAHSFLLPNSPYPENCQSAGRIIEKNAARIVDVEKLTGLTFFTELAPYEALRLRTLMPQRTFS